MYQAWRSLAIGAANELAKRAAQLITRLGPVAPSCVALPRYCSPSGTRSKNYVLIHPIEPPAILP
jgi:hypothetical protein